jgi:hypothetical protein
MTMMIVLTMYERLLYGQFDKKFYFKPILTGICSLAVATAKILGIN